MTETMTARLFKVYCYRPYGEKQIWYEVETPEGKGIAWSPTRSVVLRKARELGFTVQGQKNPVVKFYRTEGDNGRN